MYKFNSRENRLKLLAGLVDSDGNIFKNNCFEISNQNELLANDIVYLIRSVGFSCCKKFEEVFKIFIYDEKKDPLCTNFKVIPIQDENYYGFTIDGNHRFLLGDFTVTHNTILSINLACEIRLKTLIIVNKIVLINQWEESILNFCPDSKIQKLNSKSEFDDECDFYIINATNIPKKSKTFFKKIALCIVDELHLIMAESLSKGLQYIFPRYLIGLSATPYRTDGLDPLIELYFGKNRIIRLLKRKHTVYKVFTDFTPTMELTEAGKLNWGALLDSQCNDIKRNELIISIAKKCKDRNILILTKRVEQGQYLYDRLFEEGEHVASLLKTQQEFDRESRILVASIMKAGTGFDFKKLDCLILASDLESYFIQALGRVLRRPDVEPIIFDLIDNNRVLDKHFKSREEVYNDVGGIIKIYPKFT